MSTAVAKKNTASPKRSTTDASNKTTKSTKSTKPAKSKRPKSSKSKTRKIRKANKKKGGVFSCCSSKRKVKRSSRRRSGGKKKPVRKVPAVAKPDPKSQKSAKKSAKKSTKEIAAAKATKAQILQKKGAQKPQDPAKKVASPKKQAPPAAPASKLRSGSSEPLPAPQTAQTPTTPTLTSATQTDQMVTAPSTPVGDSKSCSQEPAVLQSPKEAKPEEKKTADDTTDDDEPSVERKSVSYPSHKFFMTQYVKDDCRIRRWVYEDSVPLAMESNMRHMLKVASVRLAHCRNENERRGEMMNDLKQLSQILEGHKK